MTGVRFLFRVTLRRHDLAAEVWHMKEPEKLALVISAEEIKRLLAMAQSLKTRVLLSLGYTCGLRSSEIVRLKVKHIDTAQNILRIEQSKARKDRNVMLSPEMLDLLRQWWKARPSRGEAATALQERCLFPGRRPGARRTGPVVAPVPRDRRGWTVIRDGSGAQAANRAERWKHWRCRR
jgi:integrase/recombinase XerD